MLCQGLRSKMLKEQLGKLQQKIVDHGVSVDKSLEEDIGQIMNGQNIEATPHMKFFWQEQIKLSQSSSSGGFALPVYGKSPAAYRELRDSGALVLPSERVLRDYKNYFTRKAGINNENVDELRKKVSSFTEVQRYVVLVVDEMKIQLRLFLTSILATLLDLLIFVTT